MVYFNSAEDLIPLIIVIVLSVISALNRKKKRAEGRNIVSHRPQSSGDNEFLNWLEKLGIDDNGTPVKVADEMPQPAPAAEVVVNNKVNERTPPVRETILNKYAQFGGFITPEERESIMASEGISSLKPKKAENIQADKAPESTKITPEKLKMDFDLKQAVIYSEILNRKYV